VRKKPPSWEYLLKSAQNSDTSSLTDLIQRLEPGLMILVKNSLYSLSKEIQHTIVDQTLIEFREKIQQVKSSPKGFARALMQSKIMDILLKAVQNGEKTVLNELISILYVRLREDPQFSTQGWGSEIDDDLLQDACEVFINKIDAEIRNNPYLYFKQIVKYKIQDKMNAKKKMRERIDDSVHLSHVRDNGNESKYESFDVPYIDNFTDRVADRDLLNHILAAIDELSEFCQKFFKALYCNESEKLWRIITKLKLNMNDTALNTRIHRCRHSLREILVRKGISCPEASGLNEV